MEKGPPSPLRLPSPFPKLLFWSLAGGVTPQAEKDGQSPGEDGGRHDWPCSGIKSARSQRPGAFALAGWGTGQAVFPPCKKSSSRLAVLHPKTGTCMQIGRKGFGREGERPTRGGPQGRARYDEGSYGHRDWLEGGPFPRKGVPPPQLSL